MNKRITGKERADVTERARGLCEYCLSPARFATRSFSVEHIHPRVKGGSNALNNLAFACQGCNGAKMVKTTGYDAFTKTVVLLYHPRQQRWGEHFAWSDDFLRIIGLTSVGRASIHEMKMNREPLMNLRMALCAIGQHPPEVQED